METRDATAVLLRGSHCRSEEQKTVTMPDYYVVLHSDNALVFCFVFDSTMTSRKKELALQMVVNNEELWEEMLSSKGLIGKTFDANVTQDSSLPLPISILDANNLCQTVVDVYQGWCGPCKTVVNLFRKIRNELGDDLLHFAVAEVDSIDSLEKYRGKCEPTFLFYGGGELTAVVRGANAPLLQKTILEQLEAEKKVLDHGAERVVIQDEAFPKEEESTAVEEEDEDEEDEESEQAEAD
ncbi:hypothetical protein lerEdw1_007972 [Lerista edwardsae]|nr:hypothetical protein lerEdw1_007972 [Lerista edwardsae]